MINLVIRGRVLELLNEVIRVIIVAISNLHGVVEDLSALFNISFNNMSTKVIDSSGSLSGSLHR